MKENDSLEQFLQGKISEKSFPYQPAYWDQAQAEMAVWEAEDRRKKRLLWIWVLNGLCWISLMGWGAMYLGSPQDATLVATSIPATGVPSAQTTQASVVSGPSALDDRPVSAAPSTPAPSALTSSAPVSRSGNGPRSPKQRPAATAVQPDYLLPTSLSETAPPQTQQNSDEKARSVLREKRISVLAFMQDRPFFLQAAWEARDAALTNPKLPYRKNLHLFLQTGNAFSRQRTGESGGLPTHSTAFVGLGVRLAPGPKIALESGLSYHQTPLSGLSAQYEATTYNFAATQRLLTWQPTQLHWLSVPLRVHYRLLKRHELQLGAALQTLLTTRGALRNQQTSPFQTGNSTQTTAWGYTEGLRTWDVSLQAGYRWYFGSRLGLDLQYQHGLRNLVQAEAFGTGAERFDRQARVGLIYFIR